MAFYRRSCVFVSAAVAASLAGCAYVRPTKPPSLGIPVKIVEIGAVESASQLLIDLTAPAATTDRAVLRTLQIDLRIGAAGPGWEATARRIEVPPAEPGPVHVRVPAAEWVGQEIEIRARTAGKHNRFSEWSDAVRFKVVPPLQRPVLKLEAVLAGVHLTWTPSPGAEYRIYRLAPAELKPSVIATVKTSEYVDSQTQYLKAYEYSVLAFVASGNSEAESEMSEMAAIAPVDVFPPAVPTGLAAVLGLAGVELSWNPDTEPDLRGYYLYRSAAAGPFERIGGLIQTPAYSDRATEAGKRYRYQVSAVDQAGNESARSPVVEMGAQQEP
jgi:hypothetical protein